MRKPYLPIAEPLNTHYCLGVRLGAGGPTLGNLRLAIHLYNHEDDIEQIATALTEL